LLEDIIQSKVGRRPGRSTSSHPLHCRYQSIKRVQSLDIPESLKEVCDPQRLALVVYDMQVGILKQIKNPEATVGKV
jgi:hypothetical protein